jgi:nucleoid-associated protein YgaU
MSIAGGSLVKAKLKEDKGGDEVEFKFNPTEYSIAKSARWHAPPVSQKSKAGSKPYFASTEPQKLTMQVFFDQTEEEDGDVTDDVETLLDWTNPTRDSLSKQKPEPPALRFIWGSNTDLADHKFYLASVTAKYILFSPDGTPIRATADLSLQEIPDEPKKTNPTSGALHARSTHTMADGDSLQSIATREYGDPNLWRGLAAFNDIDDPLRVGPGTDILIPTPPEADALSRRER